MRCGAVRYGTVRYGTLAVQNATVEVLYGMETFYWRILYFSTVLSQYLLVRYSTVFLTQTVNNNSTSVLI